MKHAPRRPLMSVEVDGQMERRPFQLRVDEVDLFGRPVSVSKVPEVREGETLFDLAGTPPLILKTAQH